jgi:serine/threonine-protein kinase RsbW
MAVDRTLIDLDLPAVPASVRKARRAMAKVLHGVAVDRDAVVVMVSEAVANSAEHAYPHSAAGGRVQVHAELNDQALEVVVSDDGVGIAARPESAGLGLGVPLMGDVADGVEFAGEAGTRVTARFELFGPAGPHGRALPREPFGGRSRQRVARLLRFGR